MTEITAVLNVHEEGRLAHASLLSIRHARDLAAAAGVSAEIIVIADCADAATLDYLAEQDDIRIVETDVDDLGLARNAGAKAALGRFIAFLDGDDLWGPNWLLRAYEAAIAEPRPTIWHPEACLYFGATTRPRWLIHPDIETADGDWVTLGVRNHWTSLSFGACDIYRRIPYSKTDLTAGFGYEDWCWNEETVSQGCLHKPVQGTIHMIRVRADSLVRRTVGAKALRTPSTLFRSRIGWTARITAGVASQDGNGHEQPV
ncbi:glycosyltransferase family 2 protein [Bosea sp. PAMC 26642]|uniref:glycosyltransferase family 2 protein n=1 Tax=Bosea sp. (strain PAMC 26642) TaxID=1792307 RepID=UPI00076FFB8D|nr:glycosyltransferase family 2 protein [Bosea sp. PAMC 26642]AMJ62698.1 hypothetical protein AXW83_22505 [Bosea sp. PAMC 26642]